MAKLSSTKRDLARGIPALSRTASAKAARRWAFDKTRAVAKPAAADAQPKAKAPAKEPRYYAADQVRRPLHSNRANRSKQEKLRKTLTPGTIVILLAGRFKGRRVVFLKQLESGLLLITGPYQANGVPLRRVNQAYVIATSTKVDVSSVDVASIDDAFFASAPKTAKADDDEFFTTEKKTNVLSPERKATQEAVDTALLAAINDKDVEAYLHAVFSLRKGQYPHLLKF